jgi:hypothetical protein
VLLRLRNFFKASEGKKTSLKINEVVEGIVTLVRHELERNHVLLRTDLSERLPTVQGDSVQLQQVGIEEEKLEAIFQPFIYENQRHGHGPFDQPLDCPEPRRPAHRAVQQWPRNYILFHSHLILREASMWL